MSTILEANPYRTHEALAAVASLVFGLAILVFSLRRIAWRPVVPRDQADITPASEVSASSGFVDLMRVVETEKGAQVVAEATGRDLDRPGLTGLGLGAILLPPLVLLFGFGTALGWAAVTAALFLGAIGIVNLAVLFPTRFQPADTHGPTTRMYFVGGIAAAFLGLAALGALVDSPLQELHGLEWLG